MQIHMLIHRGCFTLTYWVYSILASGEFTMPFYMLINRDSLSAEYWLYSILASGEFTMQFHMLIDRDCTGYIRYSLLENLPCQYV